LRLGPRWEWCGKTPWKQQPGWSCAKGCEGFGFRDGGELFDLENAVAEHRILAKDGERQRDRAERKNAGKSRCNGALLIQVPA
jgi:hypothetical protein